VSQSAPLRQNGHGLGRDFRQGVIEDVNDEEKVFAGYARGVECGV